MPESFKELINDRRPGYAKGKTIFSNRTSPSNDNPIMIGFPSMNNKPEEKIKQIKKEKVDEVVDHIYGRIKYVNEMENRYKI